MRFHLNILARRVLVFCVNSHVIAFCLPGVDWIQFGANDLNFDLEHHSHSPFETVSECAEYVAQQLQDVNVRVDRA